MSDAKRIREILRRLNRVYGPPARLKKTEPIGELIRTVLSQNTSDRNSLAAFAVLKRHFKSWGGLLKTRTSGVAGLIKSAGLANVKSGRIKNILAEIKRREGSLSLSRLKSMGLEESSEYLRSLKGVGPKTAACVLLFSFGKPVMPVDTHVFRVTKRLGIIGKDIDIEEAHHILSGIVPKDLILRRRSGSSPEHSHLSRDLIYAFHLGIIEHGRRTCKANRPLCGRCVIYKECNFSSKRLYKRKV
jgi:endonuclease-3